MTRMLGFVAVLVAQLAYPQFALAYRPFDSTDDDVTDEGPKLTKSNHLWNQGDHL
jgi:hypothetical protein